MTPESLGFTEINDLEWRKAVRGREVAFRSLTDFADFGPVETLQRDVMGASDLDVFGSTGLVIVAETGGHVLAAYIDDVLAGAVYGFGGYHNRTPRIVSDWMGVAPEYRSAGLGAELKKLQATVALAAGFQEIVWTVDPLRAANARLNIERLGAWSDQYEENRYGESYATGLYGGLPTDRLHMTWSITDPNLPPRLMGQIPPRSAQDVKELDHFRPRDGAHQSLIYVPANIDQILENDRDAALRWRLILREAIQTAFEDGYVIRGFVPAVADQGDLSAYLIERRQGN
jgi:predicted GNAT superfamily acetyltransferase